MLYISTSLECIYIWCMKFTATQWYTQSCDSFCVILNFSYQRKHPVSCLPTATSKSSQAALSLRTKGRANSLKSGSHLCSSISEFWHLPVSFKLYCLKWLPVKKKKNERKKEMLANFRGSTLVGQHPRENEQLWFPSEQHVLFAGLSRTAVG